MKKARLCILALGSVPAWFGGCTLGPDYARPSVATPMAWKEASPTTAMPTPPLSTAWWRIFEEPELDALETSVLAANPDLDRAMSRVAEARALARLGDAERFPVLSAGHSVSRQRASGNRANGGGAAIHETSLSSGFELGYELDAWGRARRAAEAARAEAGGVTADFAALRSTLTAEAARHFFVLRAIDAEREVMAGTLALRRDAVQLQATRSRAGLINEVDLTRAEVEVANVEAELHELARRRARLEHALAVLCGKTPADFTLAVRASSLPCPRSRWACLPLSCYGGPISPRRKDSSTQPARGSG